MKPTPRKTISLLLSLSALTALSTSVLAATVANEVPAFEFQSAETMQAQAEAILSGKDRVIASGSVVPSEDMMSPEYKQFRDKLVNASSANALLQILNDLDANYDKLPNDLKFVAAQIIPLRAYRGYTYRMIPVINQARVTREQALQVIRNFGEMIMIELPDTHWKAAFDLITEPFGQPMFKTEEDVQAFFKTGPYKELSTAATRIAALSFKTKPIVWDNKIRFGGESSFPDSMDRFQAVGEAERFAVLAKLHRRMFRMSEAVSYSLNGLIQLRKEIGQKYGLDSVDLLNTQGMKGLTRKERRDIIVQPKYSGLFKRNPGGVAWMNRAFNHLKASVQYTHSAWAILKTDKDADYKILDADLFRSRDRQADLAMTQMVALVSSKPGHPAEIRSSVTGETTQVDLAGFYSNPPADLKDMFPTTFDTGTMNLKKTVNGHAYPYRNYFSGSATGWNATTYSKLFPQVQKPQDVAEKFRIVSESRGGKIVTVPLLTFIR